MRHLHTVRQNGAMAVTKGRMHFSYDDPDSGEKAFYQRREELAEAFGTWLDAHDVAGEPSDAELLMDWKFGYGDGALDTWTVPDVREFLLDWCPRKLSAVPADCVEIPQSVAAFVEFLAHHQLLAAGSQAPARIRKYCEQTSEQFVREMSDPANFGMAKGLLGGGDTAFDGSPESLAALLEQLQAQPPGAIDGHYDDTDDDGPTAVGPVRLPDLDDQLAAIRDAPDVRRLRELARWCPAPGQLLTAKGNLRIADARHLVELLDTDDDVELAGVRKLTTAADLPHLDGLIETAVGAGIVRRQKGRLVAVARFAELDEIDAYAKMVRAAVEPSAPKYAQGPLAGFTGLAALTEVPATYLANVSALLLARGADGLPCDQLIELALTGDNGANAAATLLRGLAFPNAARLLDRLVGLGAIAVTEAGEPCPDCDEEHVDAVLTAAGVPIAIELARAAGFTVIVRPDPAGASAADLVELLGYIDPAEWERDAASWFAARPDPAAAAAELVGAITAADQDLYTAAAGLTRVETVLGEHAVDAVRAQLGGPHDAVVVQWLIARSALDPASIDPIRIVSGLVDVLGAALDNVEPAEVMAFFDEGGRNDQVALLAEIWRLDNPRLAQVLEAIGTHHPVKKVAKAARRALMKYRSRVASG